MAGFVKNMSKYDFIFVSLRQKYNNRQIIFVLKMEDYWKVPRVLIYRERDSLNDFGVRDSDTLNGRLFNLLLEHFRSANDAKTLLLQCFNNAYYLCTVILLEDYPDLCVDKYEKNLLDMHVHWKEDTCAALFALAYEMLQVCNPKLKKDGPLLQAIYHRFRYGHWNALTAANSFYKLIDRVDKKDFILSMSDFAPRDIRELIYVEEESFSAEEIELDYGVLTLAKGADYVCEFILKNCSSNAERTGLVNKVISRMNSFLKMIDDIIEDDRNQGVYTEPSQLCLPKDYYSSIYTAIEKFGDFLDSPQLKEPKQQESLSKSEVSQKEVKDSKQEQRIADYEKELAKKNKTIEQMQEAIREMESKIKDYESIFDQKTRIGKGQIPVLTGREHMILYLAFLSKLNSIPYTRTNISYDMSMIAMRTEGVMYDYLRHAPSEDECKKLCEKLQTKLPKLEEAIMMLPQELNDDKANKNSQKALKKHKG